MDTIVILKALLLLSYVLGALMCFITVYSLEAIHEALDSGVPGNVIPVRNMVIASAFWPVVAIVLTVIHTRSH